MILVDTSIWIDHFRKGNAHLKELLIGGHVACHPFVIGELACGNLKKRREIVLLLHALPSVNTVSNDEILYFIEEKRLMGLGIGIVDVHLLASAKMTNTPLWTTDGRLKELAKRLDILYRMT
ncbi:PIN domain-containing protein [Desulfobacterota bacterium AH_259_B03_O07]|nr:PIN domain-containing protein [Desulfobacterota bacterium AH_259_B03_O07]